MSHKNIIAKKEPLSKVDNNKNDQSSQSIVPLQITNTDSNQFSDTDSKVYIQSFSLWLEPDEVINTLSELLLSDDPEIRIQAVKELAITDNEYSLKRLVSALNDKDSHVRSEIIYALGHSNSNSEYLLGQIIFNEQEPLLRRQAVEFLAFRASPAAISLIFAARNDSDERVKEEAQYWIDTYGWEENMTIDKTSNSIFSSDYSAHEKMTTIQNVIHQSGQEEAISIFQNILSNEDNIAVKLQTMTELSTIDDDNVAAALATALGDDELEVRFAAVEKLGEYGTDAIPFLGQAMFSDPNPELRRRAYELLILQSDPTAEALILTAEENELDALKNAQ
ncbi:MAG: HEAT repeat domain-containing protein [gamma proteobacterium symbiont of Bathyaustriella thionipta]|nr:HEAT repeat domain-containing protein [gamma proteobacterium symbiont of Bathyaustriella thionipta]MCU7950006.1 HEAT repeat domain-containing protein [gamma proteobacterium symbiont of Bathyaustriella thionipta]MCU7953805.1 HEAT repeat domain-containing protein [gamma proteobacterium symbiont of Bathyaustriella thionipta]MCU7956602.1 HEAT repeat domain-containing protein [gamma proteobacterium symbiont of Bathyaustriella thionipta]MCU7968606.1 HEAT repeat domain-containing protein [gamma pro